MRRLVRLVAVAVAVSGVLGVADADAVPKRTTKRARKAPARTTTTAHRPTTTTVKKAAVVVPTTVPPTTLTGRLAADLFARVNLERAARGIAPVVWDPRLAALAQEWSGHIAVAKFEHRDLSAALHLPQLDDLASIGENIAKMPRRADQGAALHDAWMHSDAHRANLLQPGWDRLGIGVVCDSAGNAWATQNFGRKSQSTAPPAATYIPAPVPEVATAPDGLSC